MTDDPSTADLPVTKRLRWFRVRIATSIFFGLLTVALVVLWVRSYWRNEVVTFSLGDGQAVTLGTGQGNAYLVHLPKSLSSNAGCYFSSIPLTTFTLTTQWPSGSGDYIYVTPFLLVAITTLGISLASIPWRFSLRTMLIATTLVACLLGLAVWMVR